MTSGGGSLEISKQAWWLSEQLLLSQLGSRTMLMFLTSDILDPCHLVLGLLFLIIIHWTIQTIKNFKGPGSKKKQKYLTPCLTSLQRSKDKDPDPERSSEDLNLEYTLRTLDRNIQYLAWQMQRIADRTARSSASNTSVETVVSVHSWTHLSEGSQSRKPPSPVPASLGREIQSRELQQHLIRPPGAGLQQARTEALSHRKVDFNIRQKQLKEQWGGPTPHSESLTRLIPSAPALPPAPQRTDPSMQIRAARILSYKEQELLNWHIQKKHQQKEAPLLPQTQVTTRTLIGNDRTPAGGTVHWMVHQRSRSHTPPQSNAQGPHTPPRSPCAQSPGPRVWPPVPLPPPEKRPPSPVLICKSESRSKLSGSVQVKVSGRASKEELAEMLTMLGRSKSPTVRESERPRSPREQDRHSPGRRPGSPKEDLSRVGRVSSPKEKQAEVKVSLRADKTLHTLSWTNMPEILRPSLPQEPPAAPAQPKFLDPSFMCQNQLEFPCIAVERGEPNQKCFVFAEPHPRPPAGTPKPQCLAHTIMQSLDTEQAMRDLQMQLAKGLETGNTEPSVEYPLCLLCGRCTPFCPHPRTQHSPHLLVYPRLDVRDGEAYMTLGFLLKIKRSEADEWGLTRSKDILQTPLGKERPPKKEKTKRTTPRKKGQLPAARPRLQEPQTPGSSPPVVRKLFPETGDRNIRSPVASRRVSWVSPTTPVPGTPQTPKTPARPPRTPGRPPIPLAGPPPAKAPLTPARPPVTPAKPPVTPAKPPLTPATQASPKTPEKPPSIMKQLISSIKRFWARVRREAEKCPENCTDKFCPKKISPSKKPGTSPSAPVSPQARKESGTLSLQSPTSGAGVKGDISKTRPAATPQTSQKPGTPIIKTATSSPVDHSKLSLRFNEPDSPFVPKKGASSLKKSPKTPRKSPSLPRRTPSRQGSS